MVLSILPAESLLEGDGRAAEGRTLQTLFLYISVEANPLQVALRPPVTMRTWQPQIYLNEIWSKTYIVARVRGVEGTGVKSPCDVEVGQVVGPAGSGVAGHFTGDLPGRSSPHSSSSEDITLT